MSFRAWPILTLSLLSSSQAGLSSAAAPEQLFHFRDPDFVYGEALPSLLAELSVDSDVRISIAVTSLKALPSRHPTGVADYASAKGYSLAALIAQEGLVAGMDPGYLVRLARRESRFNPLAESPTSTAAGLFQFTNRTWLCNLREFGPGLGISASEQIYINDRGACDVSDTLERDRLLALRSDPIISTRIAAAFSLRNYRVLSAQFGRPPTTTELYILHFFGESSGLRFLHAADSTPWVSANTLNRGAAASNPGIFFNASGRPKNVADVFENLRLP